MQFQALAAQIAEDNTFWHADYGGFQKLHQGSLEHV